MQIFTADDQEFPALLTAWKEGRSVGKYWRDGKVMLVAATRQFVLILPEGNPNKIAIKPVRGINEAEMLAVQLINREKVRGNEIELSPDYSNR